MTQVEGETRVGLPDGERRKVILEVVVLYLVSVLAIKGVVWAQEALRLPADVLVLVPAIFIYVPVLWLRRKGLEPRDHGLTSQGWPRALWQVSLVLLVIMPPFILGNHLYQGYLFGRHPSWRFPGHFWDQVLLYHLFFVALPEECFYRGYMQSRLNLAFGQPWKVFGIPVGWGLVVTALLFTLGHSIVVVRWWHFAIFFPALVFGLIRERTGTVVASSIFHAFSNILMVVLETMYGVLPP